jgi:hypothetical protein
LGRRIAPEDCTPGKEITVGCDGFWADPGSLCALREKQQKKNNQKAVQDRCMDFPFP